MLGTPGTLCNTLHPLVLWCPGDLWAPQVFAVWCYARFTPTGELHTSCTSLKIDELVCAREVTRAARIHLGYTKTCLRFQNIAKTSRVEHELTKSHLRARTPRDDLVSPSA